MKGINNWEVMGSNGLIELVERIGILLVKMGMKAWLSFRKGS